jgi:AcrR family transcriptional regulator
MARIVKEEAYAVRRNEILDVTQRLVYTKGYEQMTIQDILDELQISKGAFYHYFDSKQALLEALIERTLDQGIQLILPIVQNPHLPALEKLQSYFATIARWRTAQKAFFLSLLRVWYNDDNAIVRQKMRSTIVIKGITSLLTGVIRQGIQEGVFTTSYPDQVGEVIVSLGFDFQETIGWQILSFDPQRDDILSIERTVAVYTDAFERVLGAPTGSLHLVDAETLKEWFLTPRDNV